MKIEKKTSAQISTRFTLPHSATLLIKNLLASLFQIEIDQINQTIQSHDALSSPNANLHHSFFIFNNNEFIVDIQKIRQANKFIQKLLVSLKERNVSLFVHAVVRLGISACKKLLQDTKNVQKNGGLLTQTGDRRTPGGVFLFLLRLKATKLDIDYIWANQKKAQTLFRRDKKAIAHLEKQIQKSLVLHDSILSDASMLASSDHDCSFAEREDGEI
ncbi:uncharacterized protein LOC128883774 [Hylaeus volcanicus]|uniref:uncharacterized protein LOC128883774 n=1 Tax=Hylaeus volcanicus TaxID=313075 RepID=UPI0023B84743|nr:uncharacterized protein LOC128883774 [Hylaeus volcanicus]